MAAGRAYTAGESVVASKKIPLSDSEIPAGTPGKVVHNSKASSLRVRVKFQGIAGSFRAVPKSSVKP